MNLSTRLFGVAGRLLGWLGVGAGVAFVALGSLGLIHDGAANTLSGLATIAGRGSMTGLEVTLSIAAAMACAMTSMGWNGVYFAELARRTPPEELATVAGATQFITFFGSMSGPVVFGEILRHGGSYSMAYLVLAALPAGAGWVMLRGGRTGE